ncbi:hypothetical protein HDU79_008049 [Rhizoclosmatium sp. JEL0117]|nr:hypothetical protein HDU79_008049 [Rhizoclosmatium sp. JEL0117]
MSFEQSTAFSGTTCIPGTAIFGVTASIPTFTNNKSTCSSTVGSGFTCKSVGTFSESYFCSTGAQDLLDLMSGPVLTINIYSDAACNNPIETVAAMLDKCISMSVPAKGIKYNVVFTASRNGTVEGLGATMYDDIACKIESKDQTASSSAVSLPQCEGQGNPAIGQCVRFPENCTVAFSSRYNGVTLGSFKYEQVVAVPVTKSSVLGVGMSFLAGIARFLMI